MNIDVNTRVGQDGSVTCDLSVGGQKLAVIFENSEITVAFDSAAGKVAFMLPQSLVARAVQG